MLFRSGSPGEDAGRQEESERRHGLRTAVTTNTLLECDYLFDGSLLERDVLVLENVDGFQDVFLQAVLGLLELVPDQGLGLEVSLGVSLGGGLG